MKNFSNYNCIIMLLFFVINKCKTDDVSTNDLKYNFDSGLDDDISEVVLKVNRNVCEIPFDEGDCRDRSLTTNEDSENWTSNSNELLELEDLKEFDELNELGERDYGGKHITRYFGYNSITKQCEQFYYDGCGGNENRFKSINECRKTCYTPLNYFLAKVQDQLLMRIINSTSVDK